MVYLINPDGHTFQTEKIPRLVWLYIPLIVVLLANSWVFTSIVIMFCKYQRQRAKARGELLDKADVLKL